MWSCGENENIPNPTPTTRFSCGLVVDSNTKICLKNVFPPRFTLTIHIYVMKSTTRPQENLVVGVGLGIFSFYNLQLYIFTTLQLLQLLHCLVNQVVNQVVNGEHCGESSECIKKMPNPTPTTRFSCGGF